MKYKNPFVDESAFEGDEGPKKSEDEVLMDEAKQHTEVQVVETYMALGMVVGLAIGAAFGSLLLGKMTTGMALFSPVISSPEIASTVFSIATEVTLFSIFMRSL